jgi:hypothetical protein
MFYVHLRNYEEYEQVTFYCKQNRFEFQSFNKNKITTKRQIESWNDDFQAIITGNNVKSFYNFLKQKGFDVHGLKY